jgi:aminopeptidase N
MQSFSFKHTAAAFLLTASLLSGLPARAQETAKPEVKPLPTAQWMRGSRYDVQHYKIDVRFDWAKETVTGTTTITLKPVVPKLRRVELDAGATMRFSSITSGTGTKLKFEMKSDIEKVYVDLEREYAMGETVTLVIAYDTAGQQAGGGLLGAFGNGLVFIKPSATEPNLPMQIWSQGETQYNHNWFPCYDFPNDKATSEMTATVEKKYTVVSNGRQLEDKDNADGTHTVHWKMDQPHASYLISIAVGEFAAVEQKYADIPVISYVYKGNYEDGKRSVANIADMVKFFSESTGVKYQYPKYAQTMLAKFGGGMENISSTHLTDTTVIDGRAAIDAADDSDGLQAHELAHQWFGDLVTCRDWSEIWLNESFATYFDALYVEHHRGRDEYLQEMVTNQNTYYRTWDQGVRRPIVTKYFSDPDAVFDTYAYPRGAAVLGMLRFVVGDEAWWRGINIYLNRHKFQPVETADFRRAMEEASGQGLDWFFDQWLYKMGHPVFEVSHSYDATKKAVVLTVKQTQKPDPTSKFPQAELFRTPVDIGIIGADGKHRVERVFVEAEAEQSFTFPMDAAPKMVAFDYQSQIIKELKEPQTPDELRARAALDPDPIGRITAIRELSGLEAKTGYTEATLGVLTKAVSGDGFRFVRQEAATALGKSETIGDPARTALLAATSDKSSRVRRAAVTSLGNTKDAKYAAIFRKLAETDQSYFVAGAAYEAFGKTKSPEAYDLLARATEIPSYRGAIRSGAVEGLIELGDARAYDLGVRMANDTKSQAGRGEGLQLVSTFGKGKPEALKLLSGIAEEAYKAKNLNLTFAALNAIGELGDPAAIPMLETLELQVPSQGRAFVRSLIQKLKKSAQK